MESIAMVMASLLSVVCLVSVLLARLLGWKATRCSDFGSDFDLAIRSATESDAGSTTQKNSASDREKVVPSD